MASKPLIILCLLLVCSVLASSRHLEESTHKEKAEEKSAAHLGDEEMKDDTPHYIGYRALAPTLPIIPGPPSHRCHSYYRCRSQPP